jgi:copper(I)-binding protein
MAIDWVATLQVQADLVLEISTEVAKALDASDLAIEQASRLYRMVEQGARDFDAIVEIMDEHDVEDAIVEAAETIEDTWTNLSVATANRLRTMRGLKPIDIGPEDDGV